MRMKKFRLRNVIYGLLLISLVGCVKATHLPLPEPTLVKNYYLNQTMEVRVGETMIETTATTFTQKKEWVGFLFASDGWNRTNVVDRSIKNELIYSGKSGNTLRISYREYSNDLARPAFFQDLTYNLNESKYIVFKNYKIHVLQASNSGIKFQVVEG